MAITIKTPSEIEILRECGRRLAESIQMTGELIRPGITTGELDAFFEKTVRDRGDVPAFKNYKPAGARTPYPASVCISVNNEVVHGIPGGRVLEEGDIVTLDGGITHRGLITDHAVTFPVGKISEANKKLLEATERAMYVGIEAAKGTATVQMVGRAIEKFVAGRYGIVEDLAGHGVGYKVHEDPYVPNYDMGGKAIPLRPGMVIAIEPMLCEGTHEVRLEKDGYTFTTRDGKQSAHFEHTIVITKGDPEILTKI
jgi:methionyl aminopeptidase